MAVDAAGTTAQQSSKRLCHNEAAHGKAAMQAAPLGGQSTASQVRLTMFVL